MYVLSKPIFSNQVGNKKQDCKIISLKSTLHRIKWSLFLFKRDERCGVEGLVKRLADIV
jgi:hypothetical protein